ncbi:MAG TPA: hypothetical protein VND62_08410 [Acidimicrobiales bacterium]|nr:hypothetical protein [Acidimicrobiales bacterium]
MPDPTADAGHDADRMPTDDEERAAERAADQLEESGEEASVAEHYEEMARRGTEQKGEGRIE